MMPSSWDTYTWVTMRLSLLMARQLALKPLENDDSKKARSKLYCLFVTYHSECWNHKTHMWLKRSQKQTLGLDPLLIEMTHLVSGFIETQVLYWRRQCHPTQVLLPGKSHGWRSLVGYSPWGCEESDITERLHFHFSLSCIGEGNGNPLRCSCLENPRDGGAWWAAVYGVAQSRAWLMWLSSSSRFFMSQHRKNSARSKVIGKKWIYLERYIFYRQNAVHHRR